MKPTILENLKNAQKAGCLYNTMLLCGITVDDLHIKLQEEYKLHLNIKSIEAAFLPLNSLSYNQRCVINMARMMIIDKVNFFHSEVINFDYEEEA